MNLNGRVEEFRVRLGLLPWDEFRKQMLDRWTTSPAFDKEHRAALIAQERQCGRTTRELLYAIAEADMKGWDLLVIGYGSGGSSNMRLRALELVERLEIKDMNVRSGIAFQKEVIVYVDHLVGRAARICTE